MILYRYETKCYYVTSPKFMEIFLPQKIANWSAKKERRHNVAPLHRIIKYGLILFYSSWQTVFEQQEFQCVEAADALSSFDCLVRIAIAPIHFIVIA